MATQGSGEHVRHLQWSHLAGGLRRRERAEEGPDADDVSIEKEEGAAGSFVAGFRREEREKERGWFGELVNGKGDTCIPNR